MKIYYTYHSEIHLHPNCGQLVRKKRKNKPEPERRHIVTQEVDDIEFYRGLICGYCLRRYGVKLKYDHTRKPKQ